MLPSSIIAFKASALRFPEELNLLSEMDQTLTTNDGSGTNDESAKANKDGETREQAKEDGIDAANEIGGENPAYDKANADDSKLFSPENEIVTHDQSTSPVPNTDEGEVLKESENEKQFEDRKEEAHGKFL